MQQHKFHPSILRAYDIRGVYNQTLFDNDGFFLGRSFGSFLNLQKKKKIAVAMDGRISSPTLHERLVQGLVLSGMEVVDVGVGPTPMLYFAVHHLNCDAGIMVTGSHNPGDQNGFKITLRDKPFFGDDIKNLAKLAESGEFIEQKGHHSKIDIKNDYVERLLSDCFLAQSESELLNELEEFTPPKKLRIVWDAGNGAAGEIVQMLCRRICAEHIELFCEIDGKFPNHHPDPTQTKNLSDLINVIHKKNCDLGIAFDGDGDRIGVVDNVGEVIWGDKLMIFFARDVLETRKQATVIADVKASNLLFEEIKKAGGKPLMYKTGHSFIKSKMKETNAALAGEMSGHIFFADQYYGFDDGLYAAIRLLNIIAKSPKSLSEMRLELQETFTTEEIRIDCKDEEKFAIIAKLVKFMKENGEKFDDIDGVRATNEKGWWLIRASNTQAALVARCEGNSPENLVKIKANLRSKLEFCGLKAPLALN